MSPIAMGRLWSFPLLVLALLLSALGFVPAAHAEDVITGDNQDFVLAYDCLEGQTLVVDPGQFRVKLVDGSGNTVGYDEIVSAAIYMHPVAQFSPEDQRTQVQWGPGTETTFVQETGLPLNDSKVLWVRAAIEWTDATGVPEYLPTQITCAGEPLDTDGDGVPDDLDQCPALAGNGSSNGCPDGAVINITNVQAGHSADGQPGSATLTVTNPVDAGGAAESYEVAAGGSSLSTSPLADGETSAPITFEVMPGEHLACATSDLSGHTTCVPLTVPDDPQPAHAGKVVFQQTCTGLRWTVTNTGWKSSIYSSHVVAPEHSDNVYEWTLAPGESRVGNTPRYAYRASVRVTMRTLNGTAVPNSGLGTATWRQPAGCTPPMSGGDKLISWGKVTRKYATPRVTILTKAYSAVYGYQIRGRGVVWFSSHIHPGTHTLRVNTLRIPRHQKRTVRLWVKYTGAGGHVAFGSHAFTGWHVYKRP